MPDAVCDKLRVLGDYDYRPAAEAAASTSSPGAATLDAPVVDVDILGHIFEQSISDLERLRESLNGNGAIIVEDEKNDRRSRRKREGAFYTPSFITRYIVEQALGGVLRERFEAVRLQHEARSTRATKGLLIDPSAYDRAALNPPVAMRFRHFGSIGNRSWGKFVCSTRLAVLAHCQRAWRIDPPASAEI